MRLHAAAFAFLAAMAASLIAQAPEDPARRFDEAEAHIVRLRPSAFANLPAGVVRELERRGCRVPQTGFQKTPHNAIEGSFAKPGQTDWAVLCSVRGVSTILVFWNGSGKNPAAIAPFEDRIFLQGDGAGKIVYSRVISPANEDFTMTHYRAYGGPKPPPVDHQGIDDAFAEKGSTTWYFYRGMWLMLSGAD